MLWDESATYAASTIIFAPTRAQVAFDCFTQGRLEAGTVPQDPEQVISRDIRKRFAAMFAEAERDCAERRAATEPSSLPSFPVPANILD
jgi:hypothetical protein